MTNGQANNENDVRGNICNTEDKKSLGSTTIQDIEIPKSAQCRRCMKNLLSTLDSIQSKPSALFQAMGVNVESYERQGDGIKVHIPEIPSTSMSMVSTSDKNTSPKINNESVGFGFGGMDSASDNSTLSSGSGDETVMGKLKRQLTQTFQSASSQISSMGQQQSQGQHIDVTAAATVATSAIETESANNSIQQSPAKPAIDLQIHCKKCGTEGPEGGARAYVRGPNPLSIVLCSNRLATKAEIEQVLIHELIHVYDVHARNWDLTNCYTLAKSEVRAAREAECSDASLSFTKRLCVKEKAIVATKNMFPDLGPQCVGAVFEEAMKDHAPFFDNKKGGKNGGNYVHGRSFQSTYPGDQPTQ